MKKTAIIYALMFASTSALAVNNIKSLDQMNLEAKKEFIQSLNPEVVNYLVENPEVLMEASEKMKDKNIEELKDNIYSNKDRILDKENSLIINGDKKSSVSVVIFNDYQNPYSKKSIPIVNNIVKKNKNVQFIFKDLPDYRYNEDVSEYIALSAIKTFNEKGKKSYLKFRSYISENKITQKEDIDNFLKKMKVSPNFNDKEMLTLTNNIKLSDDLDISTTPAILIMNEKDRSVDFIPGFSSEKTIQDAINKISKIKKKH